MTMDLIDRAFLSRHEASLARGATSILEQQEPMMQPVVEQVVEPIVADLLRIADDEWMRLVARVGTAVADGARVIALAGRERGEGRSTVARGLVHLLREQGHAADLGQRPDLRESDSPEGRMRDCVVCDAGVWFPPGPVHRGRLARAALGCDVVILVRRAARPPCPAHEQALVGLGIRLLGEIVTFAGSTMAVAP